MKRHAALFKNIAAFIMLMALIALLLPLCEITAGNNSETVSGLEVLKIGMNAGYEYYRTGSIENNYVLAGSLTWGDIKAGVMYAAESGRLKSAIVGSVIAGLPVVFCFLSMLFTFTARGKKTMILPTLLIALTFLENIILIVIFFRLQKLLFLYIDITLLVGMYAFAALSGIALVILGLLWLTGGFIKPEGREYEEDGKKDKNKKKDKSSARDRRRERRKKNRKKKQSKKKKRNKREKENREKENRSVGSDEIKMHRAGHITGLTGMYQGVDVEISKLGTFTIGTTQEAVNAIQKGTMDNFDKVIRANCEIAYREETRQYIITSHSVTEILLQIRDESNPLIRLKEGDSQVVGSNTLLYIGDDNNSIRLE